MRTKNYLIVIFIVALLVLPQAHAWYGNAKNRKMITIDRTKVGGTLTKFPVLVRLDSDAQLAATNANSSNIVFTSDRDAKLAHEIEYYDNITGQLAAWVAVPTINTSADYVMYIYYNTTNTTNQENKTGVWDQNYVAVYHFQNTSFMNDSTSKNNGSNVSMVPLTGLAGTAANFSGASTRFTANTVANSLQSGAITYSAWINLAVHHNSTSATPLAIAFLGDSSSKNDFYMSLSRISIGSVTGKVTSTRHNGIGLVDVQATTTFFNMDNWYYVVGTYENGPTQIIYVNGTSEVNSGSGTDRSGTTPSAAFYVGNTFTTAYPFRGKIDEMRVSNVSRSSTWITTEYNNQKPSSTFFSLSGEETLTDSCTPVAGDQWRLVANDTCTIAGINVSVTNWTIVGSGDIVIRDSNINFTRKQFTNVTGTIRLILYSTVMLIQRG